MSQTLGTSLFVFKVLTNIPNINALFLMNVTCVIPLVFKIVFASSRGLTRVKKIVILSLDLFAITCQATIWFISNKEPFNNTTKTKDFPLFVIASTLLMSLGWWETYSEMRFTSNRFFMFIQNQISDLRKYRSKIYVFINPLKIILTFFIGYLLLPHPLKTEYWNFSKSINLTAIKIVETTQSNKDSIDLFTLEGGFYIPLLINVISSALCYFTSRLACKVLMQSFGFALPLSLTTPVTFTILALLSYNNSSNKKQHERLFLFNEPLKQIFYIEGFSCEFLY